MTAATADALLKTLDLLIGNGWASDAPRMRIVQDVSLSRLGASAEAVNFVGDPWLEAVNRLPPKFSPPGILADPSGLHLKTGRDVFNSPSDRLWGLLERHNATSDPKEDVVFTTTTKQRKFDIGHSSVGSYR